MHGRFYWNLRTHNSSSRVMTRFRLPTYPYALFSDTLINRYPQALNYAHIKGIVGDLGDTIISGTPMIVSLQQALHQTHGIHVNRHVLSQDFGMSKHDHVKSILTLPSSQVILNRKPSNADIDGVVTRFESNLRQHYDKQGVQFLSDTQCGIRSMTRNGVLFGCTTGLSTPMIDVIEKKLPLWRPYPIVFAQRPSPAGIFDILKIWNEERHFTQHLKIHQLLKVGDSMSDLQEAQAANIPFIGVTGHRAIRLGWTKQQENDYKSELMLAGAAKVVRSFDEVAGLLCPWMERYARS